MEFNNSEINFCKSGGIVEIQTGILCLFDVKCFGMNKSMIWLDWKEAFKLTWESLLMTAIISEALGCAAYLMSSSIKWA